MLIIALIYFSPYHELKKQGRDPQKGRLNGTWLFATVIILSLVALVIILFKVAQYVPADHWLQRSFSGSGNSKGLGNLIAAFSLLVVCGLHWFTIRSERYYHRIAEKFMLLPAPAKQKTVKQALYLFLFSFVYFLLMVFII